MNMLRKAINIGYRLGIPNITASCFCKRGYGTKEIVPHKRIVLEPLDDRELIRVRGPEVVQFLQGLITNDMSSLRDGRSMYTLFLNKSGRVLYDAVIYKGIDPITYYIECDKNISYELRRHLRIFRVKRNVQIDEVRDELKPWVLFNANPDDETEIFMPHMGRDFIITSDPRIRSLGVRIISTGDKTRTDFAKVLSKPGEITMGSPINNCNYKLHRYMHGVGEGVQDFPPGKSFPLEANADLMNGISFHKGCYVGQELTARVYHTGVIRKRIMPIRLSKSVSKNESVVQSVAGAKVGNVRGITSNRGIALLRVDQALNNNELMIDGEPCYAEKPQWWPNEITMKSSIRGSS